MMIKKYTNYGKRSWEVEGKSMFDRHMFSTERLVPMVSFRLKHQPHMPDDAVLEYETDERGERVVLRSIQSTHPVYLRFRNTTLGHVDIWWRDYIGVARLYVRVAPGEYYDINTFATHPWEFTDTRTKEVYVVNNRRFYRPPRTLSQQYRINWNITTGVRTLRTCALHTIAAVIKNPASADRLDLPKSLAEELKNLITLQIAEIPPLVTNR